MVNKTVKINIKENSYEINFPNTGQQIDIDLVKIKLADGKYNEFSNTFPERARQIDMIATFSILAPKLIANLNVNLLMLERKDLNILMDAYKTQFLPWYTEIENLIENPPMDEISEDEELS